MVNKIHILTFTIFLMFIAETAFAEVSDKVVSSSAMIIYAIVLGVIAFLINLKFPKIFLLTIVITLILSSKGIFVVHDKFVGPAVIAEQGVQYKIIAYCEIFFIVCANIIGMMIGSKRLTKNVLAH